MITNTRLKWIAATVAVGGLWTVVGPRTFGQLAGYAIVLYGTYYALKTAVAALRPSSTHND